MRLSLIQIVVQIYIFSIYTYGQTTEKKSVPITMSVVEEMKPATGPSVDGVRYVYVNGQWLAVAQDSKEKGDSKPNITAGTSNTMSVEEYKSRFNNTTTNNIFSNQYNAPCCIDATLRGYTCPTSCCTVQHGDFNNPNIWDCGRIPSKYDAAFIRHHVRLTNKGATQNSNSSAQIFVRALWIIDSQDPQYNGSSGFLRGGMFTDDLCSSSNIDRLILSEQQLNAIRTTFIKIPDIYNKTTLKEICNVLLQKNFFQNMIDREEDFDIDQTIFLNVIPPQADTESTLGPMAATIVPNTGTDSNISWESFQIMASDLKKEQIGTSELTSVELDNLRQTFNTLLKNQNPKNDENLNEDRRRLAEIITSTGIVQPYIINSSPYLPQAKPLTQVATTPQGQHALQTALMNTPVTKNEKKLKKNDATIVFKPTLTTKGYINLVDPFKIAPTVVSPPTTTLGNAQQASLEPIALIVEPNSAFLLFESVVVIVEGTIVNEGVLFVGEVHESTTCVATYGLNKCRLPSLNAYGDVYANQPIRAHWLQIGTGQFISSQRNTLSGIMEWMPSYPSSKRSQLSFFGTIQIQNILPGTLLSFKRLAFPFSSTQRAVVAVLDTNTAPLQIYFDIIDDDGIENCCNDTFDSNVAEFEVQGCDLIFSRYEQLQKRIGDYNDGIGQQITIIGSRIVVEEGFSGIPALLPDSVASFVDSTARIAKRAGNDRDVLVFQCTDKCTITGQTFMNADSGAVQIVLEPPKGNIPIA